MSKGSELPKARAKRAGILPEQKVDVIIQDRAAAMERVGAISERISERVEKLGALTEEDVQEEVNAVRAARRGA